MPNKNTVPILLSACVLIAGGIALFFVLYAHRNVTMLHKANTLLESGNFLSARAYYEKIIERDPENFPAHYGLGMSWCAETIYKDELGLAKPEDWYPAIYHMTIAMNMKENKQVQETLAILHFNLGACFRKENDNTTAIALLELAVNYNPALLKALNLLGSLYHQQKDFVRAEQWYRKAVAVQPDYAMAYFNIGALAWAQQEYARSLQYFDKAVSLDPDNTYFLSWQAKARIQAGMQ